MHPSPVSRSLSLLAAALLLLPFIPSLQASPSETLVSASFDGDEVGATARPGGSPTVAEDVWDFSDTTGGGSAVEDSDFGHRYHLSDVGTSGGFRGIDLPLATAISSGTVEIRAVATASQGDRDGGFLCGGGEEDRDEWLCSIGFGGDGNFSVHGGATAVAYEADHRYQFRVTLHLGGSPTADYRVLDLESNQVVLESLDNALPSTGALGHVTFATGGADDGSFSVDEVRAVR